MRECEKFSKYTCEYCGKHIRTYIPSCIHINIAQDKPKHYFCTQECKVKWVFLMLKLGDYEDVKKYVITNVQKMNEVGKFLK